MKSVKKIYFYPEFCFLWIKCYFVITPTVFECLHFEIIKSVYSEPVFMIWQKSISKVCIYTYIPFSLLWVHILWGPTFLAKILWILWNMPKELILLSLNFELFEFSNHRFPWFYHGRRGNKCDVRSGLTTGHCFLHVSIVLVRNITFLC